jgi:outer membrane lipoprotein SlyB
MSEPGKINPLVAIAAVSVTVFSLVGIGVMTGVVPSSLSKSSDTATLAETTDNKPANTVAEPVVAPAAKSASAPAKPKVQTKHAETKPADKVASQTPPPGSAPVEQAKPAPLCSNCGVVASVNTIAQKGEGSGLGAIAGGVLGGVLGHQVGGGTGKKIATVAGAAGGAYAGHQVEKSMKSTTHYEVIVNMDDGSTRTFSFETQPAFQAGGKVRVVNGTLTAG